LEVKLLSKIQKLQHCVILTGIVVMFIPTIALSEQKTTVDPTVRSAIMADVTSSLNIELVKSDALSRVFNARLYKTEVGFKQGGVIIGRYLEADGVVLPTRGGSGGQILDYAKYVRRDFSIKSEADLLALREALLLFAPNGPPPRGGPKYGRYQKTWTVITGTYFDNLSGYIISIGSTPGRIRKIEYDKKIPKDKLGKP